jgi:hypothetical protein
MQRSALGILALSLGLAALTGCGQSTARPGLGPPPEPIIATRPPPGPVQAIPRPPRADVTPQPGADLSVPSSWTPPGGIKKGLWQVIVVHHSASPKSTPQGMNSWHLQRGWENGLGYHFVIGNGIGYPDGEVFVGPRWKSQITGAHCKTGGGKFFGRSRPSGFFNDHGIGVCLIGNLETSRPTAKQLATLRKLLAFLSSKTGISSDEIYGHREVTHKTECPGRNVSMDGVRRSAAAAIAERRAATGPHALSR